MGLTTGMDMDLDMNSCLGLEQEQGQEHEQLMHRGAYGLVLEETGAYITGSRHALAESVEHGEADPPTPQGADSLAELQHSAGGPPRGGPPVHASDCGLRWSWGTFGIENPGA